MAFLLAAFVASVVVFGGADAADPDPLTDFSNNPPSFSLKQVFKNGDVSHGPGGVRAGINSQIFPAMASQGLTYVHFQMFPCGINLPHTHPRATEMLTLVSGGPLQVGFVDTAGVAHIDTLHAGDLTIFPRGMLHYEINIGRETAVYISALNSQNPGTLTSGGALFKLPALALAATLNISIEETQKINSTMYAYGPALQSTENAGCMYKDLLKTNSEDFPDLLL